MSFSIILLKNEVLNSSEGTKDWIICDTPSCAIIQASCHSCKVNFNIDLIVSEEIVLPSLCWMTKNNSSSPFLTKICKSLDAA